MLSFSLTVNPRLAAASAKAFVRLSARLYVSRETRNATALCVSHSRWPLSWACRHFHLVISVQLAFAVLATSRIDRWLCETPSFLRQPVPGHHDKPR
jgi:hypothetical protein